MRRLAAVAALVTALASLGLDVRPGAAWASRCAPSDPPGFCHGVGPGHGPCWALATPGEREIMGEESRGWPTADNPRSSAFGCGQLLGYNRVAAAKVCTLQLGVHVHPATVNPAESMCLMRAYYLARYGTEAHAVAHRRKGMY